MCDNQQNIKDILDDAMVSTSEGVTQDSPNVPMPSTSVQKTSDRKSLCLFTNILNVKHKTEKRHVGAVNAKHRAMKVDNSLWTNKKN